MRISLSDLKRHLIETRSGIQQSVIDYATDKWQVCLPLMHVLKPKESTLNTCYDLLSVICSETYNTVFFFTTFNQ